MGGVWSGALAGGYSIAGGLGDGSPTAGSRGGALIGGSRGPPEAEEVLRLCHKLATSLPQESKRTDEFLNRVLV